MSALRHSPPEILILVSARVRRFEGGWVRHSAISRQVR
jgi:hypothetical protein